MQSREERSRCGYVPAFPVVREDFAQTRDVFSGAPSAADGVALSFGGVRHA
jgi:hypothetical protein